MKKMKRVRVPKYQKKALDESIARYAKMAKLCKEGKLKEALEYYRSAYCALCRASASCKLCVYGKGVDGVSEYPRRCTPAWSDWRDSWEGPSHIDEKPFVKGIKKILKELKWIKKNQL